MINYSYLEYLLIQLLSDMCCYHTALHSINPGHGLRNLTVFGVRFLIHSADVLLQVL